MDSWLANVQKAPAYSACTIAPGPGRRQEANFCSTSGFDPQQRISKGALTSSSSSGPLTISMATTTPCRLPSGAGVASSAEPFACVAGAAGAALSAAFACPFTGASTPAEASATLPALSPLGGGWPPSGAAATASLEGAAPSPLAAASGAASAAPPGASAAAGGASSSSDGNGVPGSIISSESDSSSGSGTTMRLGGAAEAAGLLAPDGVEADPVAATAACSSSSSSSRQLAVRAFFEDDPTKAPKTLPRFFRLMAPGLPSSSTAPLIRVRFPRSVAAAADSLEASSMFSFSSAISSPSSSSSSSAIRGEDVTPCQQSSFSI
mmetsp:Transcript_67231/g.161108  ORF Transcript_67231/g.161108 Transcript_67231/m.161108 type:complete len:322 (+) Transcript_67231:821-1786(+)